MTFFPVPHNAPPKSTVHIVRGPAQAAVKKAAPEPTRAVVMPEELKNLVRQTMLPPPPPDEVHVTETPPTEELSLPSMTQMAKNVLGSLGRAVKSAATGQGVKVTQETAEARLAICRSCPFFRHADERCSKCGCYLAAKTYLRAEKCPVGKW